MKYKQQPTTLRRCYYLSVYLYSLHLIVRTITLSSFSYSDFSHNGITLVEDTVFEGTPIKNM